MKTKVSTVFKTFEIAGKMLVAQSSYLTYLDQRDGERNFQLVGQSSIKFIFHLCPFTSVGFGSLSKGNKLVANTD